MSIDLRRTFIDVAEELGYCHEPALPPLWKPSTMYRGYEASKYGDIREINTRYVIPTSYVEGDLYMVELIDPRNVLYKVPRACVVLDAFVGSPLDARAIRFLDGSINNHCADNLEWVRGAKH